jgi:hypothetical protein
LKDALNDHSPSKKKGMNSFQKAWISFWLTILVVGTVIVVVFFIIIPQIHNLPSPGGSNWVMYYDCHGDAAYSQYMGGDTGMTTQDPVSSQAICEAAIPLQKENNPGPITYFCAPAP